MDRSGYGVVPFLVHNHPKKSHVQPVTTDPTKRSRNVVSLPFDSVQYNTVPNWFVENHRIEHRHCAPCLRWNTSHDSVQQTIDLETQMTRKNMHNEEGSHCCDYRCC